MHLEDRPDLIEKSIPDYPAMGKRILQDNGSWLRTLKKPNVELVHTRIERIVPEGVVTVDGTLHEADVICYATGFRHNDFLASMDVTGRERRVAARPVGRRADGVPRDRDPELPEPLLHVRPGHEPRARREPVLPLRMPDPLRDGLHPPGPGVRCTHDRGAQGRARRVRRAVPREIDQLVWSHPSIEHSHYKNPQGKIFTLSPWRLELYWEWTRAADPEAFVLG